MQTMSMSASGGKADIPDTRPSAASLTFRTSAVTRSLKLFCGRLAGAQVNAGTMAANGSGLQWGTVRNLLLAWVLTLPAAIVLSGFLYVLLRQVF